MADYSRSFKRLWDHSQPDLYKGLGAKGGMSKNRRKKRRSNGSSRQSKGSAPQHSIHQITPNKLEEPVKSVKRKVGLYLAAAATLGLIVAGYVTSRKSSVEPQPLLSQIQSSRLELTSEGELVYPASDYESMDTDDDENLFLKNAIQTRFPRIIDGKQVISVEPIGLQKRYLVTFPTTEERKTYLDDYLEEQTDLLNRVRDHLSLSPTIDLRIATPDTTFEAPSLENFVAYLVNTKRFQIKGQVALTFGDGSQQTSTLDVGFETNNAEVPYLFSAGVSNENIPTITLDGLHPIFIAPGEGRKKGSFTMEYLHLCSLERLMQTYQENSFTMNGNSWEFNYFEMQVLNEGVIHGAGNRALEELGFYTPQIGQDARMDDLRTAKRVYRRVNEFYDLAKTEGSHQVLQDYLQGRIR